jgi:hypothetical protein
VEFGVRRVAQHIKESRSHLLGLSRSSIFPSNVSKS